MPLTANQMAELTSVQNIFGRTTDGRALYRAFIQERATLQRSQELTHISEGPPWTLLSHDGTGWWILTTDPAWFVQLEQEIINARRQPG